MSTRSYESSLLTVALDEMQRERAEAAWRRNDRALCESIAVLVRPAVPGCIAEHATSLEGHPTLGIELPDRSTLVYVCERTLDDTLYLVSLTCCPDLQRKQVRIHDQEAIVFCAAQIGGALAALRKGK
jgi:hypothetical protein